MTTTTTTIILPISSLLLQLLPNHPLITILFNPILQSIISLERSLLTSTLTKVVIRFTRLNHAIISWLTAAIATGLLAKNKHQYQSLLLFASVINPILASINLLAQLDATPVQTKANDGERERRRREEIKHLLSFWSLFSTITILQSYLVNPRSTVTTTTAYASTITTVIYQLRRRLIKLHRFLTPLIASLIAKLLTSLPTLPLPVLPILSPKLQSLFTYLISITPRISLPSTSTSTTTKRLVKHPQPLSLSPASRYTAATLLLPLPSLLFDSKIKYEVGKLLFLWIASRRDGYGASWIWDWVLGPIFAVGNHSNNERGKKTSSGGRGSKKVVKLIVTEEATEGEEEEDPFKFPPNTSTPPHDHRSHSHSLSTSSSTSSSTADSISLVSPELSSLTHHPHHQSISTPNIPYRLTSFDHPLPAKLPSSFSTNSTSPSKGSSEIMMDLNGRNFIGYRAVATMGDWSKSIRTTVVEERQGVVGVVGDERWD